MEVIVASVDDIKFDIELQLEQQYGAAPLPFPGMDKSTAAVCEFYPRGNCTKGALCPFRHVRGDRTIVCKHWLRGLCKKGDQCEFLHEYDMSKMPECYFYSRFNACHNKECPFLHIDPESKMKDCPWYDRGFCRHGPNCRHRHVRRVLCMNYVAGFCPDGSDCKFMHPRFELPAAELMTNHGKKIIITCHYCGEHGHKALYCKQLPPEMKDFPYKNDDYKVYNKLPFAPNPRHYANSSNISLEGGDGRDMAERPPLKPLEEVTCFKCGCKGHYANKCPKGHLAFLSNPTPQGGYRR